MSSELFVSRIGRQVWAALRENGRIVELAIEHSDDPAHVGRIVKARVSTVMPSLQAAFFDVGHDRDVFVHGSELLVPGELPQQDRTLPPIEDRLKPGRELLIQISRQGTDTKGDRATSYLSFAGRFLVFFPFGARNNISRRISDPEERSRLAGLLEMLDPGPHGGFVARTAASGVDETSLQNEARLLHDRWEKVRRDAESAVAPSALHHDSALPERAIRDTPQDVERVVIDDERDRDVARRLLDGIDVRLAARIEAPKESIPLVASLSLDDVARRALEPKVKLPSGGDIVIEQTEAFVSVDVNSGRASHGRVPERNLLRTNLEAAEEIARQLRLRNLGGIVVIDFVDLAEEANRTLMVDTLSQALIVDAARTHVLKPNEFGVVHLTRKRTHASLETTIADRCGDCSGRGASPRPRFAAAGIIAEVARQIARSDSTGTVIRSDAATCRILRDEWAEARKRGAAWAGAVSGIEEDDDSTTA